MPPPERKSVQISDAVYEASSPMMYLGRMWGLFPFVVYRKESRLTLRWSKNFAVYSFVLALILVCFTIRGIVDDLQAGSAKSIRMKQQTGKYVTTGDISIVALIVLIGILGIPWRRSSFLAYIDCINEVDSIIVVSDSKNARRVLIWRLCVLHIVATIILGSDLAMWWTLGGRSKESDFLIGNYVAFYVSYYVILMLQMQYWHLIYCVQRRLKLINECLIFDHFTAEQAIRSVQNKAFSIFRKTSTFKDAHVSATLSPRSFGNVIDVLGKNQKVTDVFFVTNGRKTRGLTADEYIPKMIRAYLKLCDAADHINRCCGFSVLVILASCLLHLVVTPYFLVLEVTGRQNLLFATLQLVWLMAHVIRLCMIVEACYACTTEAKNMRPLVCRLLCLEFEESFKRQLELFATELHHRQIEFTACGLVIIDRTLITTIAGAVTTYLVILIQFRQN